jgi:hypothetical protein
MIHALIATLIFAISPLALLQFFVWYCRSLIAKSRTHDLSEQTREISGITSRTVRGDQFRRLLQLIAICPESGGDSYQLRAVSTYFGMLGFVRMLLSRAFPAVAKWIESERGGCAYAAAVVLDGRIAYTRMLMARQAVPLP